MAVCFRLWQQFLISGWKGKGTSRGVIPGLWAHYRLNSQLARAGRVEYYSDKNGVIISLTAPNGFKTTGYPLNLDYSPTSNVLMRVEGRLLESRDTIFLRNSQATNQSVTIASALAFWF